MTTVIVTRKDDHIVLVESEGHTGYAEEGSDIVCSALSTVLQTALLGLIRVANIDVAYETREGYLRYELPRGITSEAQHSADIILDTMLEGVMDLSQGYSKYIKLEVR